LTHHARDPRTSRRVPDGDENYFGFGLPAPVPYCLECTPHTSTLVFDDVLRPGYFLEWDDFPYPPSLTRERKYFGEVWMTVAFAPARGARWGTEYCETHTALAGASLAPDDVPESQPLSYPADDGEASSL
jgi:serine protease AprX